MKVFQSAFIILSITAVVLSPITIPAAGEQLDMNSMRIALEKWVETKKLISEETQKAKEQKVLLKERIKLMESQVANVRENIDETKKEIATAEEKGGSLDSENNRLKGAVDFLHSHVAGLEKSTLTLLGKSPAPLQEKVAFLSQQIPTDPNKTSLSLSIRYQNLIGVLSAINNFNNEITLTTEVREWKDKKSVEVKVIYFGLGQAYFCNKDGSIGGIGYPSGDDWIWKRQDAIATTVAATIAQHLNEQPANYETLPVNIINFQERL